MDIGAGERQGERQFVQAANQASRQQGLGDGTPMARHAATQPTEVELQLLRVLWELGPCTARQLHNRQAEVKETNYSTTVKMLNVMLDKRLVTRDDSVRPQVFRAAATRARTQRKMLHDLLQKVYDGSAKSLVMQALSTKKPSADDLVEIRRLLDELEKKQP